jgi:hypothetical protein
MFKPSTRLILESERTAPSTASETQLSTELMSFLTIGTAAGCARASATADTDPSTELISFLSISVAMSLQKSIKLVHVQQADMDTAFVNSAYRVISSVLATLKEYGEYAVLNVANEN